MSLLEAKAIEKTYPDGTKALRGVSFSIQAGEFTAIMGASGSGKSTLLHILGFLDNHTGGEYRFGGKTFDDYSPEEIAHVRNEKMGFVFQAFNLLPRMSVLENVKLPLLYSRRPEKEWNKAAEEAIKTVGLSHRRDHEVVKLSGGEKQRVAMARALINNPEVIFADEPTGNLDSKSGGQVMEALDKLHEEGHTVVLITHETYTAEYAERIIKLHDGLIESDAGVRNRHTKKENFVK